MPDLKKTFSLQSVRAKIVLAFLFGCLVILFAWGISRVVFRRTFSTINELTQPNHKLALVNELFQKVNQLDPLQKMQELNDDKDNYKEFLPNSAAIVQRLDSLKILCKNNPAQVARIDNMKGILYNREALFKVYLEYRNDVIYNRAMSKQIQELSQYIADNINNTDSSVVTRREKTTTTVITGNDQPEKEKQESFFKRLFRRKKSTETVAPASPKKITTEDVKITIDTISVAQRDSFMHNIEIAIHTINNAGRNKVSRLLKQEFELYRTGNLFISELQSILHDIQDEEYMAMQNNTVLLGAEFNKASTNVGIVLLIFLALTAVLIYLIFSDISKSNTYKEQLVLAKEKAEQGEQVKQRFLANMSHEIRTPLQSIIGFSEQLKEKDIPEKQSLEIIHRSSEHLLQIVNEVLDYSRIVSGKFSIEKADFDMQELIAEVSDTIDLQAERKNIHFILKADPAIDRYYNGDAFRLKQILYNLLGNAVKFTSEGNVSFSVFAKNLSESKTEFVFEIKDTGVGMNPEQLKKIFNAFEQAGESTQRIYGGTGLGLGIARSLAEIQGGSIGVNSEPGKGSCFTLRLVYEKAIVSTPAQTEALSADSVLFYGKIMVVDDDPFILQLCSAILNKHHLNYESYGSPKDVLEKEWDESITLVLLDIRMPYMSGMELCRLLKQKAGPQVRFVALTAQALPEERDAILGQGFSDILLKPFREKDVLRMIYNAGEADVRNEIIDLAEIEALCMHDNELIKETLDLFISHTRSDFEILKGAVRKGYVMDVKEACHRLSAKTGQVGARALSFRLKILEQEAGTTDKPVFLKNPEFPEVYKSLEVLIDTIKKHRQQLDLMPQFRI